VNLLVLGPQGAGKGTQAQLIAVDYEIPHISTGEMFRNAVAEGLELGKQVAPILTRGGLVPDELTIALIRERLARSDARDGFILDGFPRNLPQAEALDGMLAGIGRRLDAALLFDLPDEVATERMLERAAREGRADDEPEAIARRLATYHELTAPVAELYREAGSLVKIDADRPIDEVAADVRTALAAHGGEEAA
jgi:adenylate kinase